MAQSGMTTRSKARKGLSDRSKAATTRGKNNPCISTIIYFHIKVIVRRSLVIDFSLMVVGHSASASCSSRPFLFEQGHPLIQTSAIGCSWSSFDELNKCIHSTYNLDDLFRHVNFPEKEREVYSNEVKCSRNFGDGCHAIAWVKSLIQSSRPLSYSANIALDAFEKGLVPFMTSLENRPDGVVLSSFQCDSEDWDLPIFILEVHSSPYKNSVSKTAADVLDQLRLLRCFDKDIEECVGFTFPKYPTATAGNETCVTKVTVSFKKFRFLVHLTPLQIGDVRTEIVRAIESALNFRPTHYPIFCFMHFSSEEVEEASRQLSNVPVSGLHQVPTKHSILLSNGDTFWKCIPRWTEKDAVQELNIVLNSRNPTHVTLCHQIDFIGKIQFFAFPAQLPPLTKDDIKVCLFDFMIMTATALIELHEFGFAHLDVRIPNICFAQNQNGNDYIVKLIDLDRVERDDVVDVSRYIGEMYATHHGWSASQYDWKQLGLLAAEIIFETTDHNEIVKVPQVSSDDCLKKLISEGKYLGCKL